MKSSRSTLVLSLLTLTATLAGVALRIRYAAEPLWIDELHTAWTVDTHFGDIAFRAGQGNQTPVYFWISWLACQIFGGSEFVLRLPSIVFSSATILLASLFVWRNTGDALVSGTIAILVSIDSWFIFYGSEARPYALLQMLSILQVGCLVHELDRDFTSSRYWIQKPVSWPLILLTSAMIATHLTAIILVAVELLFVLAFVRPLSRNRIVLSLILSGLVLVPLFPTLVSAYKKRADWDPVSDNTKLLLDAGPSLLIYVLVPVFCLLIYRLFKGGEFFWKPFGPITALTLFWGLGPLMFVWVLEFTEMVPIAAYRYATIGSIAFPIFAGLAIVTIRSGKLRLTVCVFVLLLATGINPMFRSGFFPGQHVHYRNEDWKSAIEHLARINQSGSQPIFLFANLIEDHRSGDFPNDTPMSEYLKFPLTGIYKLPGRPEIVPMPTHAARRWNANHLRLIQRFSGAQILARVTLTEMESIVDELRVCASANSVNNIDCEIYVQPGNIIKTAVISCED